MMTMMMVMMMMTMMMMMMMIMMMMKSADDNEEDVQYNVAQVYEYHSRWLKLLWQKYLSTFGEQVVTHSG